MKISCVMNTYRRFTCVNRSINFYLNQDATIDTELIIFNTDIEYPLDLDTTLYERAEKLNKTIKIVNNNTDYKTGTEYNNIGSIRRDSLAHACGDYYICWDDDDIFLPWHIRQGVDGIIRNPQKWAWKPHTSMFWKTGYEPELACNNMEASILVNLKKLLEFGFDSHQGGGEHLNWMREFQFQGRFITDKESIPSYCFNWSDQGIMRGHKQSSTIDKTDNFKYHKANTTDYATGKLNGTYDVLSIYKSHINTIKENMNIMRNDGFVIKEDLVKKYIADYM